MTTIRLPERPRPLRAALPWTVAAAAALGLTLDRRVLALAAAPLALVAATRALREARELSRLRRAADRALLLGSRSELAAWRAAELVSVRSRLRLAHSLRRLVRDLESRSLPGASPVNRPAARPFAPELGALATRLEEPERPVSARGILLLEELLTDCRSPLYARDRAAGLPQALQATRSALGG
jgi:hypothetical protein